MADRRKTRPKYKVFNRASANETNDLFDDVLEMFESNLGHFDYSHKISSDSIKQLRAFYGLKVAEYKSLAAPKTDIYHRLKADFKSWLSSRGMKDEEIERIARETDNDLIYSKHISICTESGKARYFRA